MTLEDFKPLPEDVNSLMDTLNGEYEKHRQLKEGDVVIDLGANVGFFSQLALSKIGETGFLVAIEPDSRNFTLLRQRIQANNALLINAAAVNHDKKEDLLWSVPNHNGGHSLFKSDSHTTSQWVRTFKVSEILTALRLKPTFIKMDVEGAEAEILKDLFLFLDVTEPIDLAMELHTEYLFQECRSLLVGIGFQFIAHPTHTGVCHAWKL